MQTFPFLGGVVPCLCLAAFTLCSRADTVVQPARKFGLGDLLNVAISPDRQWMATAGSGGAFLWDFEDGNVVHRLEAHRAQLSAICFSPDGEVLLTGGFDRVIRAWNVETGEEIRSFVGHAGSISDLVFAADGKSFVSAGDNTARIWSMETGDMLQTLTVPGMPVTRARFAPDTNLLVTVDVSATNNVRVWNLTTGQTLLSFGSLVQEIAFVDGGFLVTGGSDSAVQVRNIETGELIRPLIGASQIVIDLETATNSALVIAGCHDGRVITWDTVSGEIEHSFMGESLIRIAAIPGTKQIITAHPNNLVRVKEYELGTNLRVFGGHTTSTTMGVGFSPDGRYIVSGGVEAFTRLWTRSNGVPYTVVPGHGAGTQTAVFSPDGNYVLTTFGAPIYSAHLSNPQTGLVEREFVGHTRWLYTAVFSPDGQRIATGAQDGTARLWDVATGAHIRTFNSLGTLIRSVAVSSNGMYLASGDTGGTVRLWNAENGQLLRTFDLNAGAVTGLAFSPATGDLLVAWADGFLRTFDPATGDVKLDSISPAAFLECVTFSPDGRFVLGGEGWPFFTARLWDARDGKELRVFDGHAAPVNSIAFSATGTSILTGADIVRLWSIADIAARLEFEQNENDLELRWNVGTLQHAEDVTGPWEDVTGAISPHLIFTSTNPPARFFRVRTVPED